MKEYVPLPSIILLKSSQWLVIFLVLIIIMSKHNYISYLYIYTENKALKINIVAIVTLSESFKM